MRNLRFKRANPRFDMLAFRFPSNDREHSNDHAYVAAVDFSDEFSDAPDLLVVKIILIV